MTRGTPKNKSRAWRKKHPGSAQGVTAAEPSQSAPELPEHPAAQSASSSEATPEPCPSRQQRVQHIWKNSCRSIVFALLLTTLKIFFWDDGTVARQIEQMNARIFQIHSMKSIQRQKHHVPVIDISSIEPVPGVVDNKPHLVTPRCALWKVVADVAAMHPAAIGIDVLFDPAGDGTLSPDDFSFLRSSHLLLTGNAAELRHAEEACIADLSPEAAARAVDALPRIQIRVGVHNAIYRGSAGWLGFPIFGYMGTSTLIPSEEDTSEPAGHLFTQLTVGKWGPKVVIDSFSYNLAKLGCDAQRENTHVSQSTEMSPGCHRLPADCGTSLLGILSAYTPHSSNEGVEEGVEDCRFLIDYGSLSRYLGDASDSDRIPFDKIGSYPGFAEKIAGKIVLIGRATPGETNDQFTVPGLGDPVPGVLIHAAAINTLLEDRPFFELSRRGHVVFDLVTSGLVILFVFCAGKFLEWQGSPEKVDWPERWIPRICGGLVIVGGYTFVEISRIYWTDFLVVGVMLLLDVQIEEGSKWVWSKIHSQVAQARKGMRKP